MSSKFAAGKRAISLCDRCGMQFLLKDLKKLTIKTTQVDIKVCNECWEPDHPQLQLGMYPVEDPQALRDPRPDNSYTQSGLTTLGTYGVGSRVIYWNWNPVGPCQYGADPLIAHGAVGTVTVSTS